MIDTPMDDFISIGMTFGCLQILDDGTEYLQILDKRIANIKDEKDRFIRDIEAGKYERRDGHTNRNGKLETIPEYIYKPKYFETYVDSVALFDFDNAISKEISKKEVKHYKCECRKCGKVRYYTEETLKTDPQFCLKPLYCSTKITYSTRASNANYRKLNYYKNNESVRLLSDRDAIIPGDDYCDAWNEKRKKELIKKLERDAQIIATIPRSKALNYDVDFVGKTYESLEVLECVNDALESVPIPHYNQRHQKFYSNIIVYKKYRCRCYLCGKEMMVRCDKFGIFPPTEYGYRAYNGYWSEVYCDCHPISSFQWIVNDILLKHNIDYKVEVETVGTYGIDSVTPLKYDFAVFREGKVDAFIECQGPQHYMPVEEYGGERRFAIQQRNDEEKRKYAKSKGIKLIEISYKSKKYDAVESLLRDQGIF